MNDGIKYMIAGASIALLGAVAGGVMVGVLVKRESVVTQVSQPTVMAPSFTPRSGVLSPPASILPATPDSKVSFTRPSMPTTVQKAYENPEVKQAKEQMTEAQRKFQALTQSGKAADSDEVKQAREQMMDAQNKFRTVMQAAIAKLRNEEASKPATVNPSGSVIMPQPVATSPMPISTQVPSQPVMIRQAPVAAKNPAS